MSEPFDLVEPAAADDSDTVHDGRISSGFFLEFNGKSVDIFISSIGVGSKESRDHRRFDLYQPLGKFQHREKRMSREEKGSLFRGAGFI